MKHSEEMCLQVRELCSRIVFFIKVLTGLNKMVSAKGVGEPVVLSGNWHAFLLLIVKAEPHMTITTRCPGPYAWKMTKEMFVKKPKREAWCRAGGLGLVWRGTLPLPLSEKAWTTNVKPKCMKHQLDL